MKAEVSFHYHRRRANEWLVQNSGDKCLLALPLSSLHKEYAWFAGTTVINIRIFVNGFSDIEHFLILHEKVDDLISFINSIILAFDGHVERDRLFIPF